MVSRFDRQYDRWQKSEERREDRAAARELSWAAKEESSEELTFKAHRGGTIIAMDEVSPASYPSRPAQKWSRRQEKKARMQALKDEQRAELEHREVTVAIREELGFGEW